MYAAPSATVATPRRRRRTPALPSRVGRFAGRYAAVFEKDALRVGVWHTDDGRWRVTRRELRRIVGGYRRYCKAGNSPVNLTWDHSDSARDVCGDVLEVWLTPDEKELRVLVGTNDPAAVRALAGGMPVSIQATPAAEDGAGRRYPLLLTHVALCQRPVVTRQRRAVRWLARVGALHGIRRTIMPLRNWIARLSRREEPSTSPEDSKSLTVAEVVAILNEHFDASLSDRIETVRELQIALETLGGEPLDEEAEEEPAEPEVDLKEEESEPEPPKDMSLQRVAALEAENGDLRRQLGERRRSEKADRKAAFHRRLEALCRRGVVAGSVRDGLVEAGRAGRWNLAILAPFDAVRRLAAPAQSISRRNPRPQPDEEAEGLSADRVRDLSRHVMGFAPPAQR